MFSDPRFKIFAAAMLVRAFMGFVSWEQPHAGEQYLKALEGAYHFVRGEGYSEHWHEFVGPAHHDVQLKEWRLLGYGDVVRAHEDIAGPPRPILSHPPGYSLVMAFFLVLGITWQWPLYVLQAVLDSLAPIILFSVMRSLLGEKTAFAGGMLYAFYPPFAAFSINLSVDGFVPFLAAVMAVWHGRAFAEGWKGWLRLGVLVGAACYFRPNFLVYPALVFSVSLFVEKRLWKSAAHTAVVAAVMAAALLPWAAYNHHRAGAWLFSTTGGGVGLCHGIAQSGGPWNLPSTDIKAREYLDDLGLEWHSMEADRHFKERFKEAVAEHPLAYATVLLKRVPRVLWLKNSWGIPYADAEKGYGSHYRAAHGRWQGLWRYFAENPAAVVSRAAIVVAWVLEWFFLFGVYIGIYLAAWRHGARILPVLAPVLCLILSCLMVSVESRFILQGAGIYPFFAWAAFEAFREWRRRSA